MSCWVAFRLRSFTATLRSRQPTASISPSFILRCSRTRTRTRTPSRLSFLFHQPRWCSHSCTSAKSPAKPSTVTTPRAPETGSVEKRGARSSSGARCGGAGTRRRAKSPLLFAHLDLDINDSELLHPATDHALTRTHSPRTTAAAAAAAGLPTNANNTDYNDTEPDNGNGNGDKNAVASLLGGRNTLDGEPDRSVAAEASGRNYRRGLAMARRRRCRTTSRTWRCACCGGGWPSRRQPSPCSNRWVGEERPLIFSFLVFRAVFILTHLFT